ncbi:MAG: transcriptional regulator [Gammaproteobacteria bacterium RIFCSPHIGHO2_12_FULL_45_9]|nr:MAG: transcriptional regulator [Gammaproteobacteria bacterium RIFCSPHIGHO2_12_FULL_45_9]
MLIRSPKELALLVVNQRKKLRLSQAAVGKLVGLKQQTISDFENNPEGTKLNTLFHILSAVQLDIKAIGKDETIIANTKWKEEW